MNPKQVLMQLHQLQPTHKGKRRKIVGRGGKRGTFAGRGVKGQKARAGAKKQPAIRQWLKRYPKLRGYNFGRVSPKARAINLGILDNNFASGALITPKVLVQKNLVPQVAGRIPKVKILAKGNITKKITVKGCQLSKSAVQKIKKAGGNIIMIDADSR